jgi:hypothetical protein
MVDTRKPAKTPPAARDRRGLRIALLSIAVAILLLGTVAAGLYGCAAVIHLR